MALTTEHGQPASNYGLDRLLHIAATTDYAASAAGAAVTISVATVSNYHISPGIVQCAYDAAPTGGAISVQDYAGNVYHKLAITGAGPHSFDLDSLLLPVSTGLKVVLAAPGGAIVGHLNVHSAKHKA